MILHKTRNILDFLLFFIKMLVPASKEEVFSTPGALKSMDDDQEPGNEESMNYRVAIVAIARQIYSEEDKQLVVCKTFHCHLKTV